MHLSADQLAALADNALAAHEQATAWEHLAECQPCRDCLFLLARPAESPQRSRRSHTAFIWAVAAACLLLVFCARLTYLQKISAPPRIAHAALTIPRVFTNVSLTTFHRPQPNQFVLHTGSGERWITFEPAKLFNRE